jgi:hypothetical protein
MLRILVFVVLLGANAWLPAQAETTLCTEITSLPANISTQGVYCLKHDLATANASGAAITVATNNVTIDCNDFKIGGLAAGVSTGAYGIEAVDKVNLVIRHCGVRGFQIGIFLHGNNSGGHLIEDNRVDLNTAFGMQIFGDSLTIRRNRILQTGGRPSAGNTSAVFVQGSGVIGDNLINGATPTGIAGNADAYGLNLAHGPFQVDRNFVIGLVPVGTGNVIGIWGDNIPGSFRGNTIIIYPSVTGTGISGGTVNSSCGDNSINGVNVGILSCTDAGGNVSN